MNFQRFYSWGENWQIGKTSKKKRKRSGKNAIKLDALTSLCLHHIHKNGFSLFGTATFFYSAFLSTNQPTIHSFIRWISTTLGLLQTKKGTHFSLVHTRLHTEHTHIHTIFCRVARIKVPFIHKCTTAKKSTRQKWIKSGDMLMQLWHHRLNGS